MQAEIMSNLILLQLQSNCSIFFPIKTIILAVYEDQQIKEYLVTGLL